jgi:hypothetical protein
MRPPEKFALRGRIREVFTLRVTGFRSKAVAQKLGIGLRSEETYWDQAVEKIGEHMKFKNPNIALLTHYGIKYGYVKMHTLKSIRSLQ